MGKKNRFLPTVLCRASHESLFLLSHCWRWMERSRNGAHEIFSEPCSDNRNTICLHWNTHNFPMWQQCCYLAFVAKFIIAENRLFWQTSDGRASKERSNSAIKQIFTHGFLFIFFLLSRLGFVYRVVTFQFARYFSDDSPPNISCLQAMRQAKVCWTLARVRICDASARQH